MITYCDVIERCEECPRYGDDCDGDKRVEHTDLISRADAIEAVCKGCHWWSGQCDNDKAFRCDEVCRIEALPSADAEWIPCSERLPDAEYGEGDSMLCCTESGLMYILYWNGGGIGVLQLASHIIGLITKQDGMIRSLLGCHYRSRTERMVKHEVD